MSRPATLARVPSLAFLSAVVLALPLWAQWSAPADEVLSALLHERVERGGSTGLVLGVVEGGKPRLVAAGVRAGLGSAPIDGVTVFEIGSVSKVLTTTLLSEMVGRGEVALEDALQELLPESVHVPGKNGLEITLLDLATASSGLPRLPAMDPADPDNPYADYTVDDLYAFLSGYELPREPGAQYEYSNLGMGLLGHALALRAKKSYEELVTERLLKPLGMEDTHIPFTPELRARLAIGHGADLEPVANWDLPTLAGAGAWRSTAADMLRFLAACVKPPEGPLGAAIARAAEPRRPTGNPGLSIGLGWHVLERGGRRIVWHNGGTGGYHSFLGFDPQSGANALVLSNCTKDIDDLGMHVIDAKIPLKTLPAPRAEVALAAEALERCVGRYEIAPSFALEITREGSALFAQAKDQPRLPLFAASATRFFFKAVAAEIGFTEESGRVTGLVLYQDGRETPGARVP